MNNENHEVFKTAPSDADTAPRKKSIYDGIKISKKGIDITIALLSLAIISLLAVALLK